MLGSGAFGEVRVCVHRESGAQRAVKVLRKSHMDEDEKNPNGVGASKAALDRMVEKSEFINKLDKKASKIDNENCLKYIGILHN